MRFEQVKECKGKGIRIVIIDSGLKCDHELVKGKKYEGYVLKSDNVSIGDFDDRIGHGTAVFSLIHNIVPEAEFIIFKVFDSDFFCSQETLEMALEYIYAQVPCDIINISSGTCELNSKRIYELCKMLSESGTVILSAFDNVGAISFPAAFDCVIGVDSSTECKKIDEFEFVENSIVNIRAKAGMHRVAWTQPDFAFVEGTSFSIAYVTAMVAKLMENGCRDMASILTVLRENAISIYEDKTEITKDDFSMFAINRAIVFPYSKEIDGLIRFSNLLSFDIEAICDYRMSGKIGMNVSRQKQFLNLDIQEFIIKDIEKIDWDSDFDTVVLGYLDRIEAASNCDYKEYIFKKCIEHRKNLYLFENNEKYDDCIEKMRAQGLQVFYPHVSVDAIPCNRFGKMYRNSKPIVGIFGTSSHQGKYTLQLELLKRLSEEYNVATIGTEPTAPLFGMDKCFPMGYHSTVRTNSYDSVYLLNDMIHSISTEETDLILVCSQYATIPFDVANISMFTNNQYDFLMGTQPEAIVLTINPYDEFDYVKRTIMFLESSVNSKVVAIVVYPVTLPNDWTGFYGKKCPLTHNEFLDVKKTYETAFKIPVLNLNDGFESVKDLIIDYFS